MEKFPEGQSNIERPEVTEARVRNAVSKFLLDRKDQAHFEEANAFINARAVYARRMENKYPNTHKQVLLFHALNESGTRPDPEVGTIIDFPSESLDGQDDSVLGFLKKQGIDI